MNLLPVTFDHGKLVDALRRIEPNYCVLLAFATAEPISRSLILGASVEAHNNSLDSHTLKRVK